MRNDGKQQIGLAVDLEVEPVVIIHARLPDAIRFIFLRLLAHTGQTADDKAESVFRANARFKA